MVMASDPWVTKTLIQKLQYRKQYRTVTIYILHKAWQFTMACRWYNPTWELNGLRKIFEHQTAVKFGDFANEELCVATLVDSRFKAILFTDDRCGQVIEWTVASMADAIKLVTTTTPSPAPSTSAVSTPPQKSSSIFDKLDRVKVSVDTSVVKRLPVWRFPVVQPVIGFEI